jgi:hypothetical protein
MRKWGILITVFYALVLLFLLDPIIASIVDSSMAVDWGELPWWYHEEFWPLYVWAVLLITGQALLFFVSVDTSFRRVQPRRHIAVAVITVATMVGLLCTSTIWSVAVAVGGDDILSEGDLAFAIGVFAPLALFWVGWAFVFHRYKSGDSEKLERLVGWLIKGSILELLIVVPCHIIVRQRGDCSAPGVTGYGIATGIAVMLLALGPSVLYLYQKRLAEYKK